MRTYTEQEVSAIIERAVERQRAVEEGVGATGLTLDEIERIGRETGIDPAHLRAAAAEIDTAGRTLSTQAGQSRTQVFVERWLDAPLSAAGWEDAVAHLRTSLGVPIGAAFGSSMGETVQQVGQSYEWSHTNGLGIRTRVTASPRGDRTRLHLTQLVGLSSSKVEGAAYGAIIAALTAIAALVTATNAGASAGIVVLVTVLTFVVAWGVAAPLVAVADRRWRVRKLHGLEALADELSPILQAPAADVEAAPERVAPAAPLLDLDALPDLLADEEGGRSPQGRVRG